MASGTVVVLPTSDDAHTSFRGQLLNSDFTVRAIVVSDGPPETQAARICAAITEAAMEPPLTVVAFGQTARHLPAIALAQRAAHRLVHEYVLVDPAIPPVSDAWPDARVTVFSDDATQARLRGWTTAPLSALADWRPTSD